MRQLLLSLTLIFLSGCEVTAVKDVQSIRVKTPLNPEITVPVNLPVAYYASQEELTRVVNVAAGYYNWKLVSGPSFEEALELVIPSIFTNAEKLTLDSKADRLFKFTSVPSYSNGMGSYSVKLHMDVLDRSSKILYSTDTKGSTTTGGIQSTANAFMNSYAKALKIAIYSYLNELGPENIASMINQETTTPLPPINLKDLLGDLEPSSTGSGFFINGSGHLLTASHVANECLQTEIRLQGKSYKAKLIAESQVLDLAVLKIDEPTPSHVGIYSSGSKNVPLGRQIFAIGFPLTNILSDYPSLTMGNISSIGGLKGSKSHFQFSAPVQPGNSGGPIVDYKGNLMGVVTSSLNQSMMLAASGTTSQNVNFGLDKKIIRKFLDVHKVNYSNKRSNNSFERSSEEAVKYTGQVLCYK